MLSTMAKPIPFILFLLTCFVVFSCDPEKNNGLDPEALYEVAIFNHYNALDGEVMAYLSDKDGKILVSQLVPAEDSAVLKVPGSSVTDQYDLTVFRQTQFEAPGSGVRDTTLKLSTYTGTPHGAMVHVRDLEFRRAVSLTIKFNNLTSLDSIQIPDAITFIRPQANNQFTGQYNVVHTGQFLLRVKINGEQFWRFLLFENINSTATAVNIDASLLTTIFAKPTKMTMPFSAPWAYQVDGIIDTAGRKFLAMGVPQVMPGNAIPVFSRLSFLQPVNNEDFEPTPRPYSGFRLQLRGLGPSPTDFFYLHDAFYDTLPDALILPPFSLSKVNVVNPRFLAASSTGNFDVLVMTRKRSGTLNLEWEVHLPGKVGISSYLLPDVPEALASRFPFLRQYAFDAPMTARAEAFASPKGYEAVLRKRFDNHDPFWMAKWNYFGIERVY